MKATTLHDVYDEHAAIRRNILDTMTLAQTLPIATDARTTMMSDAVSAALAEIDDLLKDTRRIVAEDRQVLVLDKAVNELEQTLLRKVAV